MKRHIPGFFLFILLTAFFQSTAQAGPATTQRLSKSDKAEVLRSLASTLEQHYVFAETTPAIVAALNKQQASGAYSGIAAPEDFAAKLTRDLQNSSQDLHFFVEYDPAWIASQETAEKSGEKATMAQAEIERLKRENFGFKELRILEGNVGYLRFNYFANPDYAHEAASAAMRFLENTDAVIIDLRSNTGGYLEMVQFLISYFLSAEQPQALYSYFTVEKGQRTEKRDWVLPFVPGQRTPEKPLYVLTSSTSFSAAEWLAFLLKNRGRATIVGEQTAGGAHPVGQQAIDSQFVLNVPIGEVKDAVLLADFEGAGVVPDIVVRAGQARDVAHEAALAELTSTRPADADLYAWSLPVVEARLNPVVLDAADLAAVVGAYEGRSITLADGELIYSWGTRLHDRLVPLSKTLFALATTDVFRFELITEAGATTGLKRIHQDGKTRAHLRLPEE